MASKQVSSKLWKKVLDMVKITGGGSILFIGINLYTNNPKFQETILMPTVRMMDPEFAHKVSIAAAKYGFVPADRGSYSDIIETTVNSLKFPNPIGIAAGFDKNGEAVESLFKMGFGFVEIGSVTPEPQPGNEKPRVFRLPEVNGVINRYGFNSDGHEVVLERLRKLDPPGVRKGVLGVNLGKNKNSLDPVNDYVLGVMRFGSIADYIVINISSPNTPGLRHMQEKSTLYTLLEAVQEARAKLSGHKPQIFLKISPDLTEEESEDIAKVITSKAHKIDGLIVGNTTLSRPNINSEHLHESGGLSGRPLKALANENLKRMARLTHGKIPIIAAGGIENAEDAFERIQNGASLIQIYTALTFQGPSLVAQMKKDLAIRVKDSGFSSVTEAVGSSRLSQNCK